MTVQLLISVKEEQKNVVSPKWLKFTRVAHKGMNGHPHGLCDSWKTITTPQPYSHMGCRWIESGPTYLRVNITAIHGDVVLIATFVTTILQLPSHETLTSFRSLQWLTSSLVCYHFRTKKPKIGAILSELNPVHTLRHSLCKIPFQ